jgi:hypothetical protein
MFPNHTARSGEESMHVPGLEPLQHLQPGGPGVIHGTPIHVPCEG